MHTFRHLLALIALAAITVHASAADLNVLQAKPTASAPSLDDWLYLGGDTNSVRKLSPAYFVSTQKQYANPSWITSLSGSKLVDLSVSLNAFAQSGATVGQLAGWNGTNWVPVNPPSGGGGSSSFSSLTGSPTDNSTLASALNAKVNAGVITSSGLTVANNRILGRNTSGSGAVEEIQLGTNLSMTGTTLNASGGATPAFAGITGSPTDNTSLASVLSAKADASALAAKSALTQVIRTDSLIASTSTQQANALSNIGLLSKQQRQVRNLDLAAFSDMQTSLSRAQASYQDNAAFTESWANLSAWGAGSTLQVNGGRLYSMAGSVTATAGANHSFVLGSGENLRAVFNATPVSGASSGAILIGVSGDTAGATPASANGMRGLFFDLVNNQVKSWDRGTQVTLAGTLVYTSYTVTVTVDQQFVSIVAVPYAGGLEFSVKFARAGIAVNNVSVLVNDVRALSGSSVGPMGVRKQYATIAPRASIEGLGRTIHWSGDGTNSFRVALPPSYDSRVLSPVAICYHGTGRTDLMYFNEEPTMSMANSLLAAGYIVVSMNYIANTSTWGAQTGINAAVAAYKFCRDNYSVGNVVLVGHSMGGIESLNTLVQGAIPGVVAVIENDPTYNLAANYAFSGTFAGQIRTAYGMAGDGSDYDSLSSGFDPALYPGSAFNGVPMYVLYSTSDTTVPSSTNGEALITSVTPYSRDVTAVVKSGVHGAALTTPQLAAMITWLNLYAKR